MQNRGKLEKITKEVMAGMNEGQNEPLYLNMQMDFNGEAVIQLSNSLCEPLSEDLASEFRDRAELAADQNAFNPKKFEMVYDGVTDYVGEKPLNAARLHF